MNDREQIRHDLRMAYICACASMALGLVSLVFAGFSLVIRFG